MKIFTLPKFERSKTIRV